MELFFLNSKLPKSSYDVGVSAFIALKASLILCFIGFSFKLLISLLSLSFTILNVFKSNSSLVTFDFL